MGSPVRAYDFLLKFLLVGDSDVGKGEILASLQDGASESPYGSHTGKLNPAPGPGALPAAPTTLCTSALGPPRDPPAGAANFLGWEMSTAGPADENDHFLQVPDSFRSSQVVPKVKKGAGKDVERCFAVCSFQKGGGIISV